MTRKIVVVECMSTGVNYVEDLIKRGFEPVIVDAQDVGTAEEIEEYRKMRASAEKKIPPEIKIIRENPNYDEILQQVRELDLLHIITGSESGVKLTVRPCPRLKFARQPHRVFRRYDAKRCLCTRI